MSGLNVLLALGGHNIVCSVLVVTMLDVSGMSEVTAIVFGEEVVPALGKYNTPSTLPLLSDRVIFPRESIIM